MMVLSSLALKQFLLRGTSKWTMHLAAAAVAIWSKSLMTRGRNGACALPRAACACCPSHRSIVDSRNLFSMRSCTNSEFSTASDAAVAESASLQNTTTISLRAADLVISATRLSLSSSVLTTVATFLGPDSTRSKMSQNIQ